MGFPAWTLWGMGFSAIAALITIGLSLLGQSPRFLRKSGLMGLRLEQQAKTFTTFGLAFLLLSFGFFVAGVPLGNPQLEQTASVTQEPSPTNVNTLPTSATVTPTASSGEPSGSVRLPATPETGAFTGPPIGSIAASPTSTEESQEVANIQPEEFFTDEVDPISAGSEITPTITPTFTPIPTVTPTPSVTPTPILIETTEIETQGSTLWLNRSPGGQDLLLLQDGDLIIVLSGNANQGGVVWREVMTLGGIVGWIPEQYLLAGD